jgi:hypothetical protein
MIRVIALSFDLPRNKPSLRVKVWRELQKIGAERRSGSYWTLPFSERNLADFKSIYKEIIQNDGRAEIIVGEVYGKK